MKYRDRITINDQTEFNQYVDDKMKFLISDIIELTFQELCLSFCIDSETVYDMLYETYEMRMQFKEKVSKCKRVERKKHKLYEKIEIDRLSFIRLKNVFKRFIDFEGYPEMPGLMFALERIYDSIMYREMVKLYLNSKHFFYDMEQCEESYEKVMKRIEKFQADAMLYGYTNRRHREENYTILEAILYCSILCCTEGRSINTINKDLVRKRDYDRAEKWFSNLSQVFFSDELRDVLIRTVIDAAYYRTAKYHNEIYDQCESLEKKIKGQKDMNDELGRERKREFSEKMRNMSEYNEVLLMLVIAELIATGVFPMEFPVKKGEKAFEVFCNYIDRATTLDDETKKHMKAQAEWNMIGETEYKYAIIIADVFLDFVEDALQSAAKLLKCLPEAIVAEDKEMYDYLQERYDLT